MTHPTWIVVADEGSARTGHHRGAALPLFERLKEFVRPGPRS